MPSTSGISSSSATAIATSRPSRTARAASRRGTSATRSVPSTMDGSAWNPEIRAATRGAWSTSAKKRIGGVMMLPPNSPMAWGAAATSATVSRSAASSGCAGSSSTTKSSRNRARLSPGSAKPIGPITRSTWLKTCGVLMGREVGTTSTRIPGASCVIRARRWRSSTDAT